MHCTGQPQSNPLFENCDCKFLPSALSAVEQIVHACEHGGGWRGNPILVLATPPQLKSDTPFQNNCPHHVKQKCLTRRYP